MPIDLALVKKLCAELAPILAAERAAGNVVDETARGYPSKLNVWLRRPFKVKPGKLPPRVTFRRVNDPHYWLSEYFCAEHDQTLACKFGAPKRP